MQTMLKSTLTRLVAPFTFTILAIGLTIPCRASADISSEAFCQLSIHLMEQEITGFQELIALVNQYQDDRDALNQQEAIKETEFAQARETILSSFGITDSEYGTYMGTNGNAVNKYLQGNPEIKQQIDELSAQVNSLMEQYETLKGVEEEIPEDEPPMD